MFNLMSNCCTWVSKIQEPIKKITIVVIGLDKAGKTSSIRGMLKVPHGVESGPSHNCVRTELRVENYLVTLLDVGGSEEARAFWRELSGEAHGIIFVIDSSDRHRMKEAREVLADLLRQPRVAGKPILVLANKQDKMNALLGNELIEILSLEKLVNQSRSLCHIEPCSALMDLRRWSDRKTLRGLRWLLRAVSLDYPELCSRVAQDSTRPLESREKEKIRKTDPEKKSQGEGKLQPICNILKKVRLLLLKKKPVGVKEFHKDEEPANEQEEEEEDEGNHGGQDNASHRDKASSALIPPKKGKPGHKTKVKEETLDVQESHDNNNKKKPPKETRKKKKIVKVKRKNKITTEMSDAYSQPVDLSATFGELHQLFLLFKTQSTLIMSVF
uniref:ADP-ribosylation factor-like 13A n=1 Tax=Gouania willdenowi TaxID=441366 RepID=A0A8C5H404_GOUWI